jgi:DNA repair exonuclease SbcCD ATPase subunit
MIILKELKWSNCFSYGEDNTLDLEKDILTQLVGTNGAGKSSIPIIIEEALFNKNSKGVKKADILNRHNGAKSYSIALHFTTDGVSYIVDIHRAANLKVLLTADGEDISSHTATGTFKTLESVLGLDFKTFSQLVYQSTTSSLQFLTATDTNRKKFLIELLNLERYIGLFDVFKDAHKESAETLSEIRGEINTIEQWLVQHKLSSLEKRAIEKLPDMPTDELDELASLQLRLRNIAKTNRDISQNEQYKALLGRIDAGQLTEVVEAPEDPKDINAEVGALTSERNQAKAVLTKLNSLEGVAKCPTCLQEIDDEFKQELIVEASSSVKSKLAQMSKLTEALKGIRTQSQRFEEHKTVVAEFERLSTLIDKDIPAKLEDEADIVSSITEVQNSIQEVQALISSIEKANIAATKHNTELEYVSKQIEEFKASLEKKTVKLKNINNEAANLEVLKKSFSTNGLVAYKIENLVKDLEEIANVYLSELSDGRFQLTFEVTNDKLNVIISDNGDTIQILALSSGELARVNTATLLAIRKLMATLSKSKINMLFLDEVINVLDDAGREKLIETLLKEVNLNTFLVSHGYTHPLLAKVNVVKEKDTSRLD